MATDTPSGSKGDAIFIYDGDEGLSETIQRSFTAALERVQGRHEDRVQKMLISHKEQHQNRMETLLAATEERILHALASRFISLGEQVKDSASQRDSCQELPLSNKHYARNFGGSSIGISATETSSLDFSSMGGHSLGTSSMQTQRNPRVTFSPVPSAADSSIPVSGFTTERRRSSLTVKLPSDMPPIKASSLVAINTSFLEDNNHAEGLRAAANPKVMSKAASSASPDSNPATKYATYGAEQSSVSCGLSKPNQSSSFVMGRLRQSLRGRFAISSTVVLNPLDPEFRALNVIQSRPVEILVCWLIVLNASVIATESDWRIKHLGDDVPQSFKIAEMVFVIMFTAELLLRICGEKRQFFAFNNPTFGWNVFDFCLVALAWMEEIFGRLTETDAPDMSTLRIVRVCRLVRIIRIGRVMRFFRDLRVMVTGIVNSLGSLTWCLLLLFMIMFTFGIVVIMQVTTEDLVSNNEIETETEHAELIFLHFGSLMRTIYTLYPVGLTS